MEKDFRYLASLFEDRAHNIEFYETREIMHLKNELFYILEKEAKQLLFLIGDPGTGKSVFLRQLPYLLPPSLVDLRTIRFDTPFADKESFMIRLLEERGYFAHHTFEEAFEAVKSLYANEETLILIDEAQLLAKEVIELIRLLADTKNFWFLLAMHKNESQKILNEPHFRSRPHRILEIGPLERKEIEEFVAKELMRVGASNITHEFTPSHFSLLYKLCRGNFRDLKKIMHRIFMILDYAYATGRTKYQKINECVIFMAALDGGVID